MRKRIKKASAAVRRERYRILISLIGVAAVAGVYTLGNHYEAGVLSYLISLPAFLGIAITSLARVNDIGHEYTSWQWQLRRVGLTMCGATSVAFLYAPFSTYPSYPSWLGVGIAWGFFLTWLTTPNMPPWHKYISGDRKSVKTGKVIHDLD